MAFVNVPKDIAKVKPKIIGGLTKRQAIGFGVAGAIGFPIYFLTKNILSQDISLILLVLCAFPPIFIAIYDVDGIPCEELLRVYLITKFVKPSKRKYKVTSKNHFMKKGGVKNVKRSKK